MLNYLNQKRIRTKNKTSGRKKKLPSQKPWRRWNSPKNQTIGLALHNGKLLQPSTLPNFGACDGLATAATVLASWSQRCRIIHHEMRILKKKKRRIGNVMFRNWVKSPKHCNFVWRKRWIQRSFIDSVMLVFPMLQCLGSPGPPAEKNHTKRCNHSQKTFFEHASWSRLLLGFKEVCGTCIYTNHPPNVLTIIIHQNGTRKSVVMMIFHQPGRPSVQE